VTWIALHAIAKRSRSMAGHALVAARRGLTTSPSSACPEPTNTAGFGPRDAATLRPAGSKSQDLRGSLDKRRQPRHLHWRNFGLWLLICQKLGLAEVNLALVLLRLGSPARKRAERARRCQPLEAHFETQCGVFWVGRSGNGTPRTRDLTLAALPFPYAGFRTGQRPLAEAVYKAASAGRCLAARRHRHRQEPSAPCSLLKAAPTSS